ncbi:glycosyltransferase family 4 protein [Methanosarcina sp. T3]|uniref:glycosyltransferase family 4 protein n=1 Tax=Methanosarcina sp. T3 TaxID=3439062 RepID=UPI003F832E96
MKIAQVCPRYYPDIGGVETDVKEISERLVSKSHNVEVITTDPSGKLKKEDIINGVKVTRFKSFAPGNAYYFAPQIYAYLKNHNYDVIHAHSYHALPALFAALGERKKKFVFSPYYHRGGHTPFRNLLHKPYKFIGKMIFSRADTVICISEYEKRLVDSDFDVGQKTVKIPNGINLSEFENPGHQKSDSNQKILLYVGRLEEYKGVQYIIQSLPELQDFRLRIVGKGPYEKDLHNVAERLEVAERIEWLKDISRKELLECYASADVFLMLSSHEAYGITVAEALASGTPCVVAMGSALEEFVDGIQCFGVDEPIKEERIINLINQLKDIKSTGKFITKNLTVFDWDYVIEEIENVYF